MPTKLRRQFCPNCHWPLEAIIRQTSYLNDRRTFRVIWEFYHGKPGPHVRRKRRCRLVRYAPDPNLPFEKMTAKK